MRDFRELKVWQTAHVLALYVYKVTADFPREEIYGLTAQLRRAVVSVGANIAEGSARNSDAAMRNFLVIAHGSAAEVQYLLLLAGDLGYLSPEQMAELEGGSKSVRRMLNGFIRFLSHAPRSNG